MSVVEYYLLKRFPVPYGKSAHNIHTTSLTSLICFFSSPQQSKDVIFQKYIGM